jgi:hypothetical protein
MNPFNAFVLACIAAPQVQHHPSSKIFCAVVVVQVMQFIPSTDPLLGQ